MVSAVEEDVRSELPTAISSLSYSAPAGTLAAGTSTGSVALWKHEQGSLPTSCAHASSMHHMQADPSMDWLPQRGITVAGRVGSVEWSSDDRCAGVFTRVAAAHA